MRMPEASAPSPGTRENSVATASNFCILCFLLSSPKPHPHSCSNQRPVLRQHGQDAGTDPSSESKKTPWGLGGRNECPSEPLLAREPPIDIAGCHRLPLSCPPWGARTKTPPPSTLVGVGLVSPAHPTPRSLLLEGYFGQV